MTDAIDDAIADTPHTVQATQVTFTVVSNDGRQKPVLIAFPKDLTYDELVTGVIPAICQIGTKVIEDQKPKSPLTLVHTALPKVSA
ncbi:MAG TPA: hypothetical protein VFJ93_07825 [Gaiellaceae bacterium]|nr:hypothetical protein [Gaiellaceae bacterium]